MVVKVQFYKVDESADAHIAAVEDRLLFTVPKPTVVQPSEIIKIKTGIVMKVPDGYIMTITTHPELTNKACELFPNVTVIDHWAPEAELELAVRNSGRNQINLMPDTMFAVGYLSPVHIIGISDFEPDIVANPQLPKTKPQKKNPFSFEVK